MGCSCTPIFEKNNIPPHIAEQTRRHPCYSLAAHHNQARMHLPVAPRCNINCNYCNRKYDCVNESRPGVTSEILSPEDALTKFRMVKARLKNLSVVGIAGPGDALANWEDTRKTLKLIRKEDPEVIFCLSTNGLMLPEYAGELIELGVNHITVTLNCLDPVIGADIYSQVNYHGKVYHGIEGAALLIENQLAGIKTLTEKGVLVKVNTVMMKGINEHHIPDVVKKAGELGAFVSNIMPLIPAPGSKFENLPQTSTKELLKMRVHCQQDLKQMTHCQQCRADAIGLLKHDCSQEFRLQSSEKFKILPVQAGSETDSPAPSVQSYKIAVASRGGVAVDQHFGHADRFRIYQAGEDGYRLLETRSVDKYCQGSDDCGELVERRDAAVKALGDCQAVLSLRIGYHAGERLKGAGITSILSCDSIPQALQQALSVLHKEEAVS